MEYMFLFSSLWSGKTKTSCLQIKLGTKKCFSQLILVTNAKVEVPDRRPGTTVVHEERV